MPVQHAAAGVRVRIDERAVEAIVVIEAPRPRQVAGLPFAQVPFAHHPGSVARIAQHLGDGPLVAEHALSGRPGRPPLGSRLPGKASGHDAAPRGRANGLNIELAHFDAIPGDAINVGRRYFSTAIEPDLLPTHVIRQKDDDVGTGRFGGNGVAARRQQGIQPGHAQQQTAPGQRVVTLGDHQKSIISPEPAAFAAAASGYRVNRAQAVPGQNTG